MATFQLWSSDAYGQGQILKTSNDFQVVYKEMQRLVSDENFNSSLSIDGCIDNAECFYVSFVDSDGAELKNVVYAGKTASNGKDKVILLSDTGDIVDESKLEELDAELRICLGQPNFGTKHAKVDGLVFAKSYQYSIDSETKRKVRVFDYIKKLDAQELKEKSVYYIIKQR